MLKRRRVCWLAAVYISLSLEFLSSLDLSTMSLYQMGIDSFFYFGYKYTDINVNSIPFQYQSLQEKFIQDFGVKFLPDSPSERNLVSPPQDIAKTLNWSTNNKWLVELCEKKELGVKQASKQFIYEFYTNLIILKAKIIMIDQDTLRFKNLKYLNVTHNKLTVLENLPESIKEVHASFNRIANFRKHNNLQFLSLVKNQLNIEQIIQITNCYPSLKCLDVAHNSIKEKDLPTLLQRVKKLQKIMLIALKGNPIESIQSYNAVIKQIDTIKYIDDLPAVHYQCRLQQDPSNVLVTEQNNQ